MQGQLKKEKDWIVEIEKKDYPLHPENVKQLNYLMLVFDNLEARIEKLPEGEFELVEDPETKITFAKLKPDNNDWNDF